MLGVENSGTVTVSPADAFGQVDPTAKRTVDLDWLPDDVRTPGQQVWFENESAFIESLGGDTATLNFNHPLAGSSIEYEFTVRRRVEDVETKVDGVLAIYELGDDVSVSIDSELYDRIIRLSVDDPTEAIKQWEARKERAIEDVLTWLECSQLQVVETYRS